MSGQHGNRFEDRDFVADTHRQRPTGRQLPAPRSPTRGPLSSLDRSGPEWLVEGRLPRIGTSMLVGAPGAGKSTLARELALKVARGRPWLDFQTRQGPVLYVYLEGEPTRVRAAFAKLGLAPEDNLHFVDSLQMSELRVRIRERAKPLEPALIVIDGLQPLLHAEALNDGYYCTTALDRILDLSKEANSHVLLVHDLAGTLAHEMNVLLGSTEHSVDTIFMLNRVGDERLLRSIQLRGRAVLTPIRIPSHDAPATDTAPAAREPDPELRRAIRAYLRESGQLATQREITQHVPDAEPGAIHRALTDMCREGPLIRIGRGEQGDPYRFTGCEDVRARSRSSWLRRVQPWARIAPVRLVGSNEL